MRKLWVSFCLLLSVVGYGQDIDALLSTAIDYMDEETQYEVDVTYALYRGIKGNKVYEKYNGIMAKYDNKRYQRLGDTEELITSDLYIKLSHEDKGIFIGNMPDSLDATSLQWNSEMLLKGFEIGEVEDKNTLYTLEFIAKGEMKSRVSKMFFDISKTTGRLLKQTIFLGYYVDFSVYEKVTKSDPDAARIEIEYSNYLQSSNNKVFELHRYFSETSGIIALSEEFKDFEVFKSN